MGRAPALLALLGALVAYYELVGHLWHASLWWDIAWLDLVLMPTVFGLVWLVLPLWRSPVVVPTTIVLGVVAAAAQHWGLHLVANFAKLGAMTFLAFWFLSFFESLGWVVLVAAIVPAVDIYSVFAGPTKEITTNHVQTFYALSFGFPAPGALGQANLGLPDLLFFALFLAATVRWGLRTNLTWLTQVASFGATMALAVGLSAEGLPALPLLSLAFAAANADLLWRLLRRG